MTETACGARVVLPICRRFFGCALGAGNPRSEATWKNSPTNLPGDKAVTPKSGQRKLSCPVPITTLVDADDLGVGETIKAELLIKKLIACRHVVFKAAGQRLVTGVQP